jgi:hypothetical protein
MGIQSGLRTFRGSVLGLSLLAAACASPSASDGPLYRWTDDAGIVRYTSDRSRIPRGARGEAEEVGSVDEGNRDGGATPSVDAPPDETPQPAPPARAADDLDARIRALEAAIARDEQALKALISDDSTEGSLSESEELREIALRLPGLQESLRALLEQRAAP